MEREARGPPAPRFGASVAAAGRAKRHPPGRPGHILENLRVKGRRTQGECPEVKRREALDNVKGELDSSGQVALSDGVGEVRQSLIGAVEGGLDFAFAMGGRREEVAV